MLQQCRLLPLLAEESKPCTGAGNSTGPLFAGTAFSVVELFRYQPLDINNLNSSKDFLQLFCRFFYTNTARSRDEL